MSDLPDGWLALKLGEVVAYGKTEKAEPDEIHPDDWILELEDIEKNTSKVREWFTFHERQSKSTKNIFKKGDVLYGKLRPYLNKVIVADRNGYCTTEIIPISPNEAINEKYLFYWLKNPIFLQYVDGVSHGIDMPRLGTEAGINAPLFLAPFNEQKRIADKLDVLLARVDACRVRLERVSALIKRFRKAILVAVTSGELTDEWRIQQNLPNWSFGRADEVCSKVQSGGTPSEGFISAPGIPFLKVYNIVNQKVNFDYRPQYVSKNVHSGALSKSLTMPGDVLMNIVGPPLGKVAIVPNTFAEWNINQALTLFRSSNLVTYEWLYYFLCSGVSVATIEHETRGSAGQTNISLSQCRNFVISIPSIIEQNEAVRRIQLLFAFADRLEARVKTALR